MQKDGIGNSAAPHGGQFGILIFKGLAYDHGTKLSILGQRDLCGRGLVALVVATSAGVSVR